MALLPLLPVQALAEQDTIINVAAGQVAGSNQAAMSMIIASTVSTPAVATVATPHNWLVAAQLISLPLIQSLLLAQLA
jgi:hypothetical protein